MQPIKNRKEKITIPKLHVVEKYDFPIVCKQDFAKS